MEGRELSRLANYVEKILVPIAIKVAEYALIGAGVLFVG